MYPNHLDECGLEAATILSMEPVNGALVHAVAERWNPRTSTFWFPWGEMTITLDEFSDLMGLPLPKLTGKRNWPMSEKNNQQYIQLEDLAKEYSVCIDPASISRKKADAYKQAMLTTTVGLVLFFNGENTIDFRVARLLRNWGHPKSRHVSIAMASLAFVYRGLNLFTSGESDVIEGSNCLIQAWFLKHAGSQASQLQTNERRLMVEHYRKKLQELDEDLVVWDYFDRTVVRPRHTFHAWRGF
ncbi:unnamed protein product [Victoria cruziana]